MLKRILITIIFIPIGILVIYKGGIIFPIVLTIITSITLWEYYKLGTAKGAKPHIITGIIISIILQVTFIASIDIGNIGKFTFISLIILCLSIFLISVLELFHRKDNSITNIAITICGIIYISLPFSFIYGLRNLFKIEWLKFFPSTFSFLNQIDDYKSAGLLISVFVSIWVGDSAAYLIGKNYGKHKLFPRVSPNKSWEGAIANLITSIITFILIANWLTPNIPLIHLFFMGLLIGSVGQLGDLAESQLKRDANVKDSSNLIPGHGGFLDRFDSIIFVMPIIFFYIVLLRIL